MSIATGELVAGYKIEGELGSGGMGVVYEARQLSLDRTVALKVLSGQLSGDDAFRERFRREGLIQARIDHPNIVPVYEAGEHDGALFLAMRLVRGHTLKELILARELEGGRTLRLLTPIADALDAAHDAGLIHRDIKPQNILVGARDRPYLADFGLTKGGGDERSLTRTGQFVGTLDYISPEQIRGDEATAASDIYSLAAVLYECLTGVVPYPRPSDVAVLFAHMTDPPPRLTEQRPELPAALDAVLARGMAKDPHERHPTATALLADAERAFGDRVRAVITPPQPIEVPEEAGVRAREEHVSTIETRVRALPVEPRASGAATVQSATQPAGADATAAAAAVPSRPSTGVWLALGAAALLALIVGFAAGHSGGAAKTPAATNSASAGALELGFPDGWTRGGAPALPGLRLRDPIALTRATGGGVEAGTVQDVGRSLLPRSFVRALGGEPRRDDPVRLGDLSAYRYRNVTPRGFGRPLTVYAAPTTAGVATVACYDAPAAQCDRLAAGLSLVRGRPLPLGPSAAYAKAIDRPLRAFDTARVKARRDLRAARTPNGQAKAAAALASASRTAQRAVTAATPGPADARAHATLVGALRAQKLASGRLAAAARAGDRAAYASARRALVRADTALRVALTRLRNLGYAIR